MTALLEARAVDCDRGRRAVLRGVSLSIATGEVVGVLGANGTGKSTLLAALSGEQVPVGGEVRLADQPIAQWSTAALATRRSVLPQSPSLGFDLPVRTVVEMGFYPHAERDFDAPGVLARAAALADVDALLDRRYRALSGGEQQRVQFARALAQLLAGISVAEPRLLLLDEPTASLDPRHQMGLLAAVRELARDGAVGTLVILHDVNLAAAWCDRLLLLADGRAAALGTPTEVLTPTILEAVYQVRVRVVPYPGSAVERPLVLFEP